MAKQAYGMANGQVTEFTAAHRAFNDTPAAMQLTLTVPMSYEDIAAVYYLVMNGGGLLSDLDDEAWAREVLFDTLFNDSAENIESNRLEMAELEPGTEEYELAQAIRARVAEIFSPVSAPAQRKRSRAKVSR
ncbi:hypothetical protein [Saccharopolyspora spinosa]|uniref:Uncharacterized protein n=1 Tax=Saccharopolyspora spinosa TaxID=60894 RepID=A0A2N3XTG5_SACSN|nr:hypothetical protein [Saccharopolyspora spinosa]PKW13911.1 hypothetical protein A8926_1480 [Saccharopolyspora spinosa]